ncbi:hypothetical protein [Pajaroellobacter abortibovis]|uniref:hypothetical protein n=1 Tax=Pajaroellobacter abortibovis TaxID=1882918 RepID=UPI0012EC92BF|nr:hypothetical protein [Pajaroellobacter abortibovis]
MECLLDSSEHKQGEKSLPILAKSIYRELRASGYEEQHVIALAGELLGVVTKEVKARKV